MCVIHVPFWVCIETRWNRGWSYNAFIYSNKYDDGHVTPITLQNTNNLDNINNSL